MSLRALGTKIKHRSTECKTLVQSIESRITPLGTVVFSIKLVKSVVSSSVVVLLAEEFHQRSRPVGLRFRPVGLRFRPVGLRSSCLGLRFLHIRYQRSHTLGGFCVVCVLCFSHSNVILEFVGHLDLKSREPFVLRTARSTLKIACLFLPI